MKKQWKYHLAVILALFCSFSLNGSEEEQVDLTVVSCIDFNGSVRRHAIGLIECLHGHASMNFIASREVTLDEVPAEVQEVILSRNMKPGKVALLEDSLWYAAPMPDSMIKIAFSVTESTGIPKEWVEILNTKFDAVVLADPFYIPVYKNSGVTIPIFHIPLGIYIDEFLEKPLKTAADKPFVFCCCSRFFKRKNHKLLIDAFIKEFGNRKDVILKLNGGGAWGSSNYDEIKAHIAKAKVSNIHLTNEAFAWKDYIEYMSAMDCYVNISRGEGFSITPRESLALGIPAIVSNNTAQKTICDSNFVRAVASPLTVRTKNGSQFNCKLEDVRAALQDVYKNYGKYLKKAHQGREWVKQYRWNNLQNKYLNLIKPANVIYGDRNEVTDEYFMTDSKKLYEKYIKLNEGKL